MDIDSVRHKALRSLIETGSARGIDGRLIGRIRSMVAFLTAATDMAIRFEKAFGLTADTLLRMQTHHDLARAREHQDDIKVARLPRAA